MKLKFLTLILFVFELGCSFSISPSTEHSTLRVTVTLGHHRNSTEVEQIDTFTSDDSLTNAVIVAVTNANQLVSGSLCQITSLEVYRGRKHITEISHDGFSLSDKGTFMVI